MTQPNLILASASARRRKLLREAGYRFRVVESRVSEQAPRKMKPANLVRYLALKKALSVAKKRTGDVVLGADTLVFVGRRAIGKPKDKRHAFSILRNLSGRWQRVYTGIAVVWKGGKGFISQAEVSHVKFRQLTESEINRAATKHLDKAGAYAVQEKGDGFVEKIRGNYDNVVGLPVGVVRRLLNRCAQSFAKRIGDKIHFQR